MKLELFQVDAFANEPLKGNPAAVMPLPYWLPDSTLQALARENNLSETAFIVGGNERYEIRWFTPKVEIELCGHATLASAYVVTKFLEPDLTTVHFDSKLHGRLTVEKTGDLLSMNFPLRNFTPIEDLAPIEKAIGTKVVRAFSGKDVMVVLESEKDVRELKPNLALIMKIADHGLIVTARGESSDFVSRAFFPSIGIDEDPVTGATHTMLTPYWAAELNKTSLVAEQLSERAGQLFLTLDGDRVMISGEAVLYLRGQVSLGCFSSSCES